LTLAEELVDGKPEAVRAYLRHFWEHWSGPTYVVDESRLNHLAEMYSKPGAFTASMMWYRASGNPVTAYAQEEPPERSNRLATPTTILWQEHDPIFPIRWSDRLHEFFIDYKFERRIGTARQKQLHHFDLSPAARPAERRAHEKLIANIRL
jgi:hypothetical protein